MKLVIDRTRWLRGDPNSFLLRSGDNKMCCLGFLAKACGYTEEQITNVGAPNGTVYKGYKDLWPEGITSGHRKSTWHSQITEDLMGTNDSSITNDADRESRLIDLFSQIGVEVEFVD